MAIYRTTNGFDTRSEPDFISILNNICEKMTGNTSFAGLQGSVLDLVAERDEFVRVAALASGGGREPILARDAVRDKIVDHLHLLGNEVTAAGKNDLLVLESSGFPLIREKQPSAPLVKPAAPVVSAGVNIGQINCVAKKQAQGNSVTYWIGTDANDRATWSGFTRTRSRFVYEKLVSGQRYYIQYELSGVRDQQVMSDVVTYIAQ